MLVRVQEEMLAQVMFSVIVVDISFIDSVVGTFFSLFCGDFLILSVITCFLVNLVFLHL